MDYIEMEAIHNSDEEDDDLDGDDDFIDTGADIPDEYEADDRRAHRRPFLPREDEQEEDVEEIERRIQERYSNKTFNVDYDDRDATYVEHQAQLPSVMGPKLWVLKCAIGREREVAFCLMQKYIDNADELQIASAIALDHLKGYIYVEAYKEAHVREAVKGMRNIFPRKITQVPIKEMTDVLSVSVESKAIDVSTGSWVRVKIGIYKGDLAKVVQVDDVRQRVTVKLIPRVDLQALVNKLEGRQVPKKTAFTPPARFMNIDEVRDLHIRVERKRDKVTGDYFDKIEGMMFQDGFLYKTLSLKSLATQNVQPTFDELEKFRQPGENEDGDVSSLSILFANRKKNHFVKGDRVIVVTGDLTNLKGWVEKFDDDSVHIKTKEEGLPKTLTFNDKELCKYFEPGNHVKVVSGATEGASGLVVSVEGHVVNIVSDTTKELHRVFADNVVETSEVASALTNIGGVYELHDLVLLDDNTFGVIIGAEGKAFQVLKGVPKGPDVAIVRLREIKCKIDKKGFAKDRYMNPLSVKDVVRILDGPFMGKQGPVEHIYRETLFIYDCHQLGHGGFICVKSDSCMMVGGSRANGDRNIGTVTSRFAHLRTAPRVHQSHMGPRRGRDALVGTAVKIRVGNYKGHKGCVVDVKGSIVRVELESQMKVVAGKFLYFCKISSSFLFCFFS
ncbi:putative transcription elongation factor spt5 homolog 1 [Phtheirospermum japonicum]|uniref:Putative transcription elongation factor spt5 homolog 1 n=1 Tax=Phtheirospermum japonicum TaxID=374723 RepID=A0A830BUN2_9LAMI|nr:putative transcription elongation factor spt5 homolog 1 [Phtheirospermum japonicum]